MLTELQNVRQIPGEWRRRWFQDEAMELIVWMSETSEIAAFELSYDTKGHWRVFKWTQERGCRHLSALSGDGIAHKPEASSLLISEPNFVAEEVVETFKRDSDSIEPHIVTFVIKHILHCPSVTSSLRK